MYGIFIRSELFYINKTASSWETLFKNETKIVQLNEFKHFKTFQ